MKYFYLIGNPTKCGTEKLAGQITAYLKARGAVCWGSPQRRELESRGHGYTDPGDIPEETECVITLGGDGTLIQAARDLVSCRLPMIGINMGTMGYLTQIARGEDYMSMLDALLEDHYRLERRMMLDGIIRGSKGEKRGIALNEIVLTRQDVMHPLKLAVYVNGVFLNQYGADGMIVATPTGSTAYNLSAGGPIVTPAARLMALTPICSHSLYARSIILSNQDVVTIRPRQTGGQKQMAVFDGDQTLGLGELESLEICESESFTTLIQLKNISFLENLRSKMNPI